MDTSSKRATKLRKFYARHKRLPSYQEMLGLFGVRSKNAVSRAVHKFIEAGIVEKDSKNRLVPGPALFGVRVLGSVQAGWPSPAEEELADAVSLDDYLIGNKEATFMLHVSGDSMIDAGIHPGDLVLVERNRTPRTGDIVIAHVDGEFTVKRLERKNNKLALVPANPKFKIIYPSNELSIEGVVVSVIRKYH